MANTININVNKTDLGLNNVDNTSDLNKPISTATQTALNGKEDVANKSTNTSLGTSDTLYPTQKAVKTYVDTNMSGYDTISTPQTASLEFRFDKKHIHATTGIGGTLASLTGNITLFAGTNRVNVTSIMLHNDSVEPTFSSEFTRSADSLPYVTGQDNVIVATMVNQSPTKVIYKILRGGTNIYGTFLTTDLKGANNGVAELDGSGKVPSGQLPSYVDDVEEYANLAAFPVTGESGKIYIALDSNLTYRWGGSVYVEISPSLALGETSASAYRGDRGKIAYDHSLLTSGNPHNVTKSDVGLSNVDNTSDVNKPISSATQTALDNKVTGPASSVNNTVAVFDSTTGKVLKQGIITDNGTNIGVSTTTPTDTLHVNGTYKLGLDGGILLRSYGAGSDLDMTALTTSGWTGASKISTSDSNGTVFFGTYGTNTTLISSHWTIGTSSSISGFDLSNGIHMLKDGKVGIGITTPTEKLHVNGNIVATNLSGTNTGDQDLSGYATKNITLDRKTASYTLVAGDNGKMIEMNVASANTLTIDASIFSAGNQILISQYGAGQTTITAGAGVTLRSSGGKLKTSAQYALVTIVAISSTEFYVAGDLTA